MTARTVSVISVGVLRTFLTPSVLMTARVNGRVGPPNEGGDLVTLVERLFDEGDAGTAGCSKDKKLHNISLSIEGCMGVLVRGVF
jgi:hypothetical protein